MEFLRQKMSQNFCTKSKLEIHFEKIFHKRTLLQNIPLQMRTSNTVSTMLPKKFLRKVKKFSACCPEISLKVWVQKKVFSRQNIHPDWKTRVSTTLLQAFRKILHFLLNVREELWKSCQKNVFSSMFSSWQLDSSFDKPTEKFLAKIQNFFNQRQKQVGIFKFF